MERKNIIIAEIKFWKKNRLLPEHYCDFLLSLYSEGEETVEASKSKPSKAIYHFIITTFALVLFGLTIVVIYFTDFSTFLQITLAFILSGMMFLGVKLVKKFDARFIHLYILLGALIVLLATIHIVGILFPSYPEAILATVIFTCLVWLFLGKKYKLKYFIFSGAIGIIIAFYFLV